MKTTQKNISAKLEEMKGENDLKDYVLDYIIDDYKEDEEIKMFFRDIQVSGCSGGMISELIYYNDTLEFYEKYKKEINDLLYEMLDSTGLSIEELFGDRWDNEDPLCQDQFNKNLLAWFGFEETAYSIARELEID